MIIITDFITNNLTYITIGISALLIITFILLLTYIIKLKTFKKKYIVAVDELNKKDIQTLLTEHMSIVKKVEEENKSLKEQLKVVETSINNCFQKHGIVRYTAFEDVGSDLSFAISLLDGKDDGILLNGIYSREGSSIFVKAVHSGQTKQNLSQEEQKALEIAKRRGQQ